jgi:hypothetical protein
MGETLEELKNQTWYARLNGDLGYTYFETENELMKYYKATYEENEPNDCSFDDWIEEDNQMEYRESLICGLE